MLWAVALLAVMSALVNYFGLHAALIVVLLVLAIVAHVAGNALGTKLRESGDRPLPRFPGEPVAKPSHRAPTAEEFAPSTELGDRRSLGLPIIVATVAGGTLAAVLGILLMVTLLEPAPTWVALIAGTVACGALGAIWTFVSFGFIQVTVGAFWQATGKDQHRQTPDAG